MLTHDFHCVTCDFWCEITFDSYLELVRTYQCTCGGELKQTWRKAPGLAGVAEPGTRGIDRTFHSGYDVQSGRHFNDRSERDKYLKGRGLMAMGPQEYNRTVSTSHSDPEPDYSGLVPAMKEAYAENESGKLTPHLITTPDKLGPVMEKKE